MKPLIAVLCIVFSAVSYADEAFQLIATLSPPGGGSFQPVLRFQILGTGGPASPLSSIPQQLTNDPVCVAFRTPSQLFVSNRHSNNGSGSVSTFDFSNDFSTFTQGPTLTGNGLANCHGISFNSINGELFVVGAYTGVVSRFLFDMGGNAIPNGTHATGNGNLRGIAIRPNGTEMFLSFLSQILRYRLLENGTIQLTNTYTGFGSAHFMRFRGDELYVADLTQAVVHRFEFDLAGNMVSNGTVASPGAIDVAFSPDGMEMFVGSHFGHGINRFAYNANTDSWALTGNIPTASLGGLATTFAPFLPGDIDQNGCVDDVDLARLLSMFGFTGNLPEDLNDDGVVDDTDLAVLLTNFGRGC